MKILKESIGRDLYFKIEEIISEDEYAVDTLSIANDKISFITDNGKKFLCSLNIPYKEIINKVKNFAEKYIN